jgi:DNA-binding IclR family transcriptional regulator
VSARLNPGLEDAMRAGHAIAIGEWREGLNAVAAGFVGPSGQRYSVNCGGASSQCSAEWLQEHVVPALHECIAKITREIGGAPARRSAV